MSCLIHPRYLSSFAAACDRDPDLPMGTHLRLFPSEIIGFPLCPWQLWDLPALDTEDLPVEWFDRHGRPLPELDLDAADGEAIGRISAWPPDEARMIGVEARFDEDVPGEIAVLDRDGARVVTSRSTGRLLVGAPQITRVRLRGRGPCRVLWWIVPDVLERMIGSDPFANLSAPLEGDFPWYAGGRGRAEAAERVVHGAPMRWTRPDRPDGPFDPIGASEEDTRIAPFRPDLDKEFELLISDPDTTPGAVTRIHDSPAKRGEPWQEVTEHIQGSLFMKALDPGVGRYLGLLTLLEHLPDMEDRPEPPNATAWLAAGLFACAPDARHCFPDADEEEQRLIERIVELEPSVRQVIDLAREQHRWTVRAFVTVALAAPVQDLPNPPTLELGDSAWLRPEHGPSTSFRQQLLVTEPPLATLVALASLQPPGWVTRHDMLRLEPGAVPDRRAAPILLGSTQSPSGACLGVVDAGAMLESGAPWVYRVALSDVFGRFCEPTEIQVPPPSRPATPAPTLRVQLRLADRVPHDQPAGAGSVRITVPVPSLEQLGAGSRPLARVRVSIGGAAQDAPVPQAGGTIGFDFALPALMPMEHRHLVARARFENDQGALGSDGTHAIDITDPRSPPIPKTGIGIIWSSRPGPAEDVEIRVRFTGTAGARYRVYSSDARGLGIPLTELNRTRTRAEVAVDGAQRGLGGLGLRERFRLLTDNPIETGADGSVHFDARFPRALETVQFLRFVPLGARGSEAPFESCPLLPVAVPSDRKPPAPRLDVRVDPATGTAQVAVLAEGLDLVGLKAAEPGLFLNPPDPSARPPEFRLRRASGVVPDAIYAREIARGVLVLQGKHFQALVGDHPGADGLIPYVRYHYWAEVRMPPERRLPPDTQEKVLTSGSIQPLQLAQRRDSPGVYSLASAPAMAMHVPSQPEALNEGMVNATLGAAPGGWRLAIAITGGPVAHARAVGAYRVQIHIERSPGILGLEAEIPLAGGALTWDIVVPGEQPASARVALVLIDPIERAGAPFLVDLAG
jgi:hypothetical protein